MSQHEMAQAMEPVEQSAEWLALTRHRERWAGESLAGLFEEDPRRFERFHLEAAGLLFDYSKHLILEETIQLLLALAERCGVPAGIGAMFAGRHINNTEDRPALHVALRSPRADSPEERQVHDTLGRMQGFVQSVLEGDWTGCGGRPIRDVVNLGIGGSDLGPAMVYQALAPYHVPGVTCHFVSNVDPAHLNQTLLGLDHETTLFVVASKSFGTLETSLNAQAARQWFLDAGGRTEDLARHFVAVSANVDKARAFGIDEANIFPMWDWVGGRYSLWSAIGLPIALGVGMANFQALLAGAHAMDQHFASAPLERNMPVLMALLTVWYLNFHQAQSSVVLPYAQNLQLFPSFLQQLDMESLGKSVRRDGNPVGIATGGIIWGSAGTNGQHSFHQLLHQGTHFIPADFIAAVHGHYPDHERQRQLLANCLAQSQALMTGQSFAAVQAQLRDQGISEGEVARLTQHKVVPGNRPSSTILMPVLTPQTLGSLIAAYEHKVYVQSLLQQTNAFDQWGVELGKALSGRLAAALSGEGGGDLDASSAGLVAYCRRFEDGLGG